MSELARYRVHLVFNAEELDRPSSFRTDVWALDFDQAWTFAGDLFMVVCAYADFTNPEIISRMSCEKAQPNLQGESPEAPYVAALRGPGERGN